MRRLRVLVLVGIRVLVLMGTVLAHLASADLIGGYSTEGDCPIGSLPVLLCALLSTWTGVSGQALQVNNGPCSLSEAGSCITSPDYPSNYGEEETCTIIVLEAGYLTARVFKMQDDEDILTIGGEEYYGTDTTGPQIHQVTTGTTVSWSSDYDASECGRWKVCWLPSAATPAPTIAPTPAPGQLMAVEEGLCALDTSSCVNSPGYPSRYQNCQSCSITVLSDGYLTATSFRTEEYDILNVDGREYKETDGPVDQLLSTGAKIGWESDYSTNDLGWRICLSKITPSPTSPPTGAPTVAGQALRVDDGPCQLDQVSHCLTSPNFPLTYGNEEACSITVLQTGYLTASVYNTSEDDQLTIYPNANATDRCLSAHRSCVVYANATGEVQYVGDYNGGGVQGKCRTNLLVSKCGPFGVLTARGGGMHWQSSAAGWVSSGWRICWSPNMPNRSESYYAQQQALLAFFDATNGNVWSDVNQGSGGNSHWSVDIDYCSWSGVTCATYSDQVISLKAEWHKMSGTLASEIGELTSLISLNVGKNSVSGVIPSELGRLTSLESLYTLRNRFSGSLPVELSEMTSLHRLDMQFNSLSGTIAKDYSAFTALNQFQAKSNEMSGTQYTR